MKRGFTLIELMVVIILIGITTAVILPEMRGTFEDARLRSTARKLVNVFNLAYSQAVTVNQLHRVRLDRKTGHYIIEKTVRGGEQGTGFVPIRDVPGGEGELDTRISIEIRRPDKNSSIDHSPDSPVDSEPDVQVRNQGEGIAFYPDGTADAVEIRLQDREGFGLSLRINPTTARVHILERERE